MKDNTVRRNKFAIILVAIAIIIIDQLIKCAVIGNMNLYDTIPIIENALHITYVLNDGAAFSMLSGQAWILCGVTTALVIAIIVYFLKKTTTHIPTLWMLGLIIGGGIGNLIDRFFRGDTIFYGKVVDYIDFRLINFAVFNFADCCVVIGVFALIAINIYDIIKEYLIKKKMQIGENVND